MLPCSTRMLTLFTTRLSAYSFTRLARYTPTKPDVLKKLAGLIQDADEVFLASDPDREGEAISWHLKDALGIKSYKRVTYTAITPQDVQAG